MLNINAKSKKLIFYAIMAGIFAYLAYIMISFYSSDRVGMVKLSYKTNEENIVTSAYATYKMKHGEGQLSLSQNNDINYDKPQNSVSCAIILSTEGKLVPRGKVRGRTAAINALKNKIKYNGMTVMRIGTIREFLQQEKSYIKGKFIMSLFISFKIF